MAGYIGHVFFDGMTDAFCRGGTDGGKGQIILSAEREAETWSAIWKPRERE